jgi:hypothetical protein
MAITSGFASRGQFDFAIPQAVNLAEAGISVQDKRIGAFVVDYLASHKNIHGGAGYAFCAELMSPGHELQLMLVNTLRKASVTLPNAQADLSIIPGPRKRVVTTYLSRVRHVNFILDS